MSSINRFGGGLTGVQGTRPTDQTPQTTGAGSGGRTGSLAETVRSAVLQGGPAALSSVPTGRFSDFTITTGGGDRTPASNAGGGDVAGFLKTAGDRLDGKPLSDLVSAR